MSAWSTGTMTARRRVPRGEGVDKLQQVAAEEPGVRTVDTLIEWIPGEVIAAYAAIILALQPQAPAGGNAELVPTHLGWLVAGVVFAGLLTWLGGWSKTRDLDSSVEKELRLRVVLAVVAFAIWSFVVPGSWWYSVPQIAASQAVVPIAVGVAGAAFGPLAEGLVRRVSAGQPMVESRPAGA